MKRFSRMDAEEAEGFNQSRNRTSRNNKGTFMTHLKAFTRPNEWDQPNVTSAHINQLSVLKVLLIKETNSNYLTCNFHFLFCKLMQV